jgi:heme/copper-type cytochrome/quinol oxidase subunit 4
MEKLIAKVNALLGKLYPTWLVGKVAEDKFMHFICGFIIAAVLTPFIGAYSILVVAIIAALKEIYDYMHPDKHTADIWDWVATTLGGVVGFVVVALFG